MTERDIVDEIDALVNEQLTHPKDDYSAPYSERCKMCGRRWHGLPQLDCPGPFSDGNPPPAAPDFLMQIGDAVRQAWTLLEAILGIFSVVVDDTLVDFVTAVSDFAADHGCESIEDLHREITTHEAEFDQTLRRCAESRPS
jgi:hypothetical protein